MYYTVRYDKRSISVGAFVPYPHRAVPSQAPEIQPGRSHFRWPSCLRLVHTVYVYTR
jgi:hypothetical protein